MVTQYQAVSPGNIHVGNSGQTPQIEAAYLFLHIHGTMIKEEEAIGFWGEKGMEEKKGGNDVIIF